MLANAAHIRKVPGRKSDMSDATWIADLLAHGLITASMIPPTPMHYGVPVPEVDARRI